MKVRSNCSESANQSRLLSGDKVNTFNAFVHFVGNERAHRAFAFPAIKITSILGQHLTRAARASVYGFARRLAVNVVADANDHENYLHHVRMIVKFTCE